MDSTEAQRIEQFLHHLNVERRLSPHTLSNYRRDLEQARDFAAGQDLTSWCDLTTHHLRALVAARHRAGIGGRSLQRLLSALRSFYQYLLREGMVSANPAVGLRAPKAPRRLPKTLDVDQTARLLQVAAIIAEGVGGEPPLDIQVVQELLDALRLCGVH